VSAVVFIVGEFISQVLAVSELTPVTPRQSLISQFQEYTFEDFSDLCIMPGIVDLNVSFNPDSYSDELVSETLVSSGSASSLSTASSSEAWEGYACGTKAAIAGGVTTVLESPTLRYLNSHSGSEVRSKLRSLGEATLYCDVGVLGYLSLENLGEVLEMKEAGVVGFKAYMIPPALDFPYLKDEDISTVLGAVVETDLPLFIHPEKTSERFLYMSSPFRKISENDRSQKQIPSTSFAAAFPEELNPSSTEMSPISLNTTPQRYIGEVQASPADERTLELLIRRHQDFIGPLAAAEMSTYHKSGSTVFSVLPNISEFLLDRKTPERFPQGRKITRPPLISCEKLEKKESGSSDYAVLLANCPTHWESNGVSAIVTALLRNRGARVHMSNMSSASAVQELKNARKEHLELYLTWETASVYLQFSSLDVSTGDTRFKTNPPVRDRTNQKHLKNLLNFNSIDTVSSYHRPVKPSLKFLQKGDFQRAMNGIASVGFTLQSTWAALKQKREALGKLSQVLCENPAQIAGLREKGSIEVGKHADLVVWEPEAEIDVGFEEVFYRHPQVSPYLGLQLPGKVHRVYLRGTAVFSPPHFLPAGKVL
jgi:dihydroorotase-like cyclic amidohydrolase